MKVPSRSARRGIDWPLLAVGIVGLAIVPVTLIALFVLSTRIGD